MPVAPAIRRRRRRVAAPLALAITCTAAQSGCAFSVRAKWDGDAGLAGGAAGSVIGGIIGGPVGAGIGRDLGYIIATAATAYGLKKRGDAKRAAATNGTTATPHATNAHIRK